MATARMLKAAGLIASGEAPTLGGALRLAGYSDSTSRCPARNGLTVERLLIEGARAGAGGEDGLSALRPRALAALKEVLEDPDAPPSVRIPAALATLKLAADLPEDGEQPDADAWRKSLRRAARLGFAIGQGRKILGFDGSGK